MRIVVLFLVFLGLTSTCFCAEYYIYFAKDNRNIDGSNRSSKAERGDVVDVVLKTPQTEPLTKDRSKYIVKVVDLTAQEAEDLKSPINEDIILQNSYTFAISKYQEFIDSYGFTGVLDSNFKILKYSDDGGYRTVVYQYTNRVKTHYRNKNFNINNFPVKEKLTKEELNAQASIKSPVSWTPVP